MLQCYRACESGAARIFTWKSLFGVADCGAAVYFGRAMDLGAAKRVIFENKKTTALDLEFIFKKG